MYLICGYCYQRGNHQNEVHEYDSIKGTLTEVTTTGIKPSPRAGHGSTMIDGIIYLYGGYHGGIYCNDIY